MAPNPLEASSFQRLRLLGEGGAGKVWLVEDTRQTGSLLALKELALAASGSEGGLRREFATLAALRHPNLVEVYGFEPGKDGRPAGFTLEYVDGTDIASAVLEEGPGLILVLAAETLRALAFLHDFGLVHRDLKPANLLVRRRPRRGCRLVVLDFGLAMRGRLDDDQSVRPGGTLPYMAPELFSGTPADRKTDLYALGALLHETVHGIPPFEADSQDLTAYVDRVNAGKRSRPQLPDGYPKGLAEWLEELLSPEPADRPAGAAEALARLNATCGCNYELETRETRTARLESGPPPGRADELARLWDLLSAKKGRHLIWLAGDAGSGKTRVLRWLASQTVGRGQPVIHGVSGGPSSLVSRLALCSTDDLRPALLRELGGDEGLVIFDETEAAHADLISVLDRVARDPDGPPVNIVSALRPVEVRAPELRALLEDCDLLPGSRRIDLNPLTESQVGEVLQRASSGRSVLPHRVQWLYEASEGNGLLLESLVAEESWERGKQPPRAQVIKQSIARRLSEVSPLAVSWLETLATIGSETPGDWIQAVGEFTADDSRTAAEELRQARLIVVADDRWSPSSRIIATEVSRAIESDRRRTLNRQAAEFLEETGIVEADPGRLARLWAASGKRLLAQARAIDAAERAKTTGSYSEAADWLRFAICQLDRRDSEFYALRRRHAIALVAALRHREAYKALITCLRLAQSPADRAELLAEKARTLMALSSYRQVIEVASEARTAAQSASRPEIGALALRVTGMAMFRLGMFTEAIPVFTMGAAEYRSEGDTAGRADCVYLAGICESKLRRFSEARAHFDDALAGAQIAGDVRLVANALVSLGNLEARSWNLSRGLEFYEKARAAMAPHGDLKRQHVALLTSLSSHLCDMGQSDRALEAAREGEILARQLGNKNWLIVIRLQQSNALVFAGHPAAAAEMLETLLSDFGHLEFEALNFVRITLADALIQTANPDHDRAAALLREVLDDPDAQLKQHMGALQVAMERRVLPGCTDPFEPVAAQYDELLKEHQESLEPPYQLRAELARIRHLIDSSHAADSEEKAREAISYADDKDLPDLGARAEALLSEIQRNGGRLTEAEQSLERGRDLLRQAAERIEDEDMRRDFLDRRVFRALRPSATVGPTTGEDRLLAIYEMIRALNSETDPELILESTLDMALKVVRAERGMILLREEGDDYRVRVARNLEEETIQDASEFSRNVVLQAGKGKAVLAVDTGEDERLRELKSVSLYGIRSVICVPLRSRGKIVGAVYLDNRSDSSLFSPEDMAFLEAFADNAALALENAKIRRELELENQRLQRAAESRVEFGNIVGRSEPMQRVYDLIGKMAENSLPVMVQGESGTGKELVARAIHFNGSRRKQAFVSENCAAITESLLESELFGHVKGAFTGADRDRAGLFEQADGGTLMLDEVGDMSAGMQARLLRVLQESEIRRVGGEQSIKVDVRIIAATNRDLGEEVKAKRFREDLLYRLQVLVIPLPPLRERPGDLPLLVEHFLRKIAAERGRETPRIRSAVMDMLERYRWPGNIRQLENVLQRLTLLAGDAPITVGVVESDSELRRTIVGSADDAAPIYSLERSEEQKIREALRAASGNRTRAAKMLGISRATIFRKIKQFGLS